LARCEASGNEKALALIASTSPVAWRHVHLGGRYAFRDAGQAIDLDTIIRGLDLSWSEQQPSSVGSAHGEVAVAAGARAG